MPKTPMNFAMRLDEETEYLLDELAARYHQTRSGKRSAPPVESPAASLTSHLGCATTAA